MNKTISIIITVVILVLAGFLFFGASDKEKNLSSNNSSSKNVEIIDGVQYITVYARGGYSPRKTIAQADIPTTLLMKTASTYDCSSSLVIRDVNYRKLLPQTGETKIDLNTQKSGKKIRGLCSMGMYSFTIDFE